MRQFRRIDENPHFLRPTTIEGDLGHAIHPAKRFDDLRFQKITEFLEVDRVAGLGDKCQTGDRTVIGVRGTDLGRAGIGWQA